MSQQKPEYKCKIGQIMKEAGLTQLELSQKSGVPQGAISRYSREDKRENFNIPNLFALRDALGLKCLDELFEEIKTD
ncbi:hypothetical protein GCM10011571_33640 [Marinithermofilum abyssi]|uniref:HTH cro/C1-type domain-containing protein n=1 Tax=Marinithermofilum abyssi TaxID=1571185 RepID=A0A8J2VMH2_9BACL|nr:helix-turn-helix transcriptional regulator [Marinithermofilum abyssi]GGE28793.1 hypothetical protein GCM10011571_33640 [Marinithermofilum abyssi]